MEIQKYNVVSTSGEEYDHLIDTYAEAVKVAELKSRQNDGEPWAVMELDFEYTRSGIVYATDGSQIWPPSDHEERLTR